MSKDTKSLLEELQRRHREAQIRLNDATQAFQAAQQAHAFATSNFQKSQQALAAAQQQFHGWNTAVSIVAAEIAAEQTAAKTAQQELPLPVTSTSAPPIQTAEPVEVPEPPNKTDIIRELLAQHPQGMTPTEVWSHVRDQFKHRAYLYSVLKRLTDRNELIERRGKYSIRIVSQEPQTTKEDTATVQ